LEKKRDANSQSHRVSDNDLKYRNYSFDG
jgi:hypothetical protein